METMSRHASSVALLVGLLFGFFVLMSYQVNRAETVSAVEGTLQTVISPAHRLVSAVWLGLSRGWYGYVGLVGSATEAATLREHNATLQRENAALQEAAHDNARLRQLLGLRSRLQLPSLAAETIGRNDAHGYETITINRGSRDGVSADSPVLAPNGALVGRVVLVSPWTSMVQLVTDPQGAVGAKVERTEAPGVVHGLGGPNLELAYVRILADAEPGDLVVTSGDDGLYPSGVPIGRITRKVPGAPVPGSPSVPLTRDETALFWDISLTPMVDVRRVDQVLVLAALRDRE